MSPEKPSPRRKIFNITSIVAGLVALGLVLVMGGFSYAANQESHDPFCASCHTEPESTFVARSTDAVAVDMASYHTAQATRCIDCHSGPGVTGRIQAEMLGARNAMLWYTNNAVQPAHLTVPISDANCLKCHQDVTQRGYTPKITITLPSLGRQGGGEAGPNHWHEQMASWQSRSASAGTCTSCHTGHGTDGTPASGFQVDATTRAECDNCHRVLGD